MAATLPQPAVAQRGGPVEHSVQRPLATLTVEAFDHQFTPGVLTIQPGTTVRWVNRGTRSQTIAAREGTWKSGDIKPGATWSARFRHPGTYHIYALDDANKRTEGTIVVSGGAGYERSVAKAY
jgi:plastocyanin